MSRAKSTNRKQVSFETDDKILILMILMVNVIISMVKQGKRKY